MIGNNSIENFSPHPMPNMGLGTNATYIPRIVPPETAQNLISIATNAVKDPNISGLARWLVRFLADENHHPLVAALSEIQAAYNWVTSHIRYTKDPYGVELVYDPRTMLQLIRTHGAWAEDCDSQLLMIFTILLAMGHKMRFTIAGFEPGQPHYFSHIFCESLVPPLPGVAPGRWVIIDPSTRQKVWEMAKRLTTVVHFYPQ